MGLAIKYTEEELTFIKHNMDKMNCKEMAIILNRKPSGLQRAITKYFGVLKPYIRTHVKSFNHDTNILLNQNLESYYWLGFIAADGSIFKHGRSKKYNFLMGASGKDKEHMEKFISYINFTGAFTKIKKVDFWSVSFRISDEEFDYLQSINITPNKSLTLKPPVIEDYNSRLAFIKGYIDGDGCIQYSGKTKTLPNINIVGTKEILQWILEEFEIKNIIQKRDNIYIVDITGSSARNVRNLMLQIETPQLDRKWRPDITPSLYRTNGLPVVSDCVEA